MVSSSSVIAVSSLVAWSCAVGCVLGCVLLLLSVLVQVVLAVSEPCQTMLLLIGGGNQSYYLGAGGLQRGTLGSFDKCQVCTGN